MQTNQRRIGLPASGSKEYKFRNKRSKSKPPAKTAGVSPWNSSSLSIPPMALSAAIFIRNRLLALPTPRLSVYALRVLRGPISKQATDNDQEQHLPQVVLFFTIAAISSNLHDLPIQRTIPHISMRMARVTVTSCTGAYRWSEVKVKSPSNSMASLSTISRWGVNEPSFRPRVHAQDRSDTLLTTVDS
jgi:hypothetical protein